MSQLPGQSVDGQYPPDFWKPGGGYDQMKQAGAPVGPDLRRPRPDIRQPISMPPEKGGGPQMSPADEAQQLQRAYRQFLGRAATPQEVQGWLSGAYGHGQSGNLLPIFEAIRTSPEAQQRPPVNRPMGPSPSQWADQARQYRAQGEAAGNDMSWMDQPGALAGPRGFVGNMGQVPQRPQGGPSAKPLGGQDVQRMRRAILGVPEF
jgi:hypothetical protein